MVMETLEWIELSKISVVARKEIHDAASNWVFLTCVLILTLSMILAGASASYAYRGLMSDPFNQDVQNRQEIYKGVVMQNIAPQMRTIGVLIAVVLSFNSINKERSEGSLKVLLSYPVYRDQVIVGKLFGGLFVLGVVVAASMAVAFSVFLLGTTIILTLDLLIRMIAAFFLTLLFLGFYLGLGMVASLVFHDLKMSLLTVFIVVGILNYGSLMMFLGTLLPELIFGSGFKFIRFEQGGQVVALSPMVQMFQEIAVWISPSQSYYLLSTGILSGIKRLGVNGVFVEIPVTLLDVFSENFSCLAVLIVCFSVTTVACYIFFMREDI